MSLAALDADARLALVEVAASLGLPVDSLAALIDFETAGSWSPTIRNPYSTARGLLQFVDATARGLGYLDSSDLIARHPTVASQLRGPVRAYLAQFAPFATDAALAMSVFYPAARTWSEDTPFPASVQRVNPGIKTVGDYVSRVRGRLDAVRLALGQLAVRVGTGAAKAGPGLAVVAGLGIAGLLAAMAVAASSRG